MAADRFEDVDLQVAYQAWMRADRGSHLDDAAWQRLGAGDAVQSERDLSFAHIMSCAECSTVWRSVSLLRQQAEAEGLIERRSAPGRSVFRSFFMPIAAAAAVVLAIGIVVITRQPASVDNTVRSATALAPVEGLMMAYASDGTPTLVWTPLAAATTYRVEMFSEDGTPVWTKDVAAPPLRWPAEMPRDKGTYRWRVEAQDADGAVARSRLMPLELTR